VQRLVLAKIDIRDSARGTLILKIENVPGRPEKSQDEKLRRLLGIAE
jgi:hypothetical protein